MFVVLSPEHVHAAQRFPCGYCRASEAVSPSRRWAWLLEEEVEEGGQFGDSN